MVIYSHPAFQSTLPRRERHETAKRNPDPQNFNPRSREGSDAFSTSSGFSSLGFQSTLPRRERLRSAPHVLHGFNFNPRSREGSDGYVLRILHSSGISIHAPAKGATSFRIRIAIFRDYFNPRSREGSDGTRDSFIDLAGYFNPRSREGSDNKCCCLQCRRIHFNPRSREGSDLFMVMI